MPPRTPHNTRFRSLAALFGSMTLLVTDAAVAHHSFAMFDTNREITLSGTVREFQWMSPHCWIEILATDPADATAAPVEWGIEMDNPLGLSRHGWKPGTLKPGDKIVIVAHPLRDGSPGGQVLSVTRADGTPIGDGAVAKRP